MHWLTQTAPKPRPIDHLAIFVNYNVIRTCNSSIQHEQLEPYCVRILFCGRKRETAKIQKSWLFFQRIWKQTGFCTNNWLFRVITYAKNTWTWRSLDTLNESVVIRSLERHPCNRNENVIGIKIRMDLSPWINFLAISWNYLMICVKQQNPTVIRRIPSSSFSSSYSTVKWSWGLWHWIS